MIVKNARQMAKCCPGNKTVVVHGQVFKHGAAAAGPPTLKPPGMPAGAGVFAEAAAPEAARLLFGLLKRTTVANAMLYLAAGTQH